jgi:hypothetical protein
MQKGKWQVEMKIEKEVENVRVIQKVTTIYLFIYTTVTFIVISGLRWLQISLLSLPSLMKRDFKTTSTSKRPAFSTYTISPDD